MALRYLFGPVTGSFADQSLRAQRRSGLCLAFGPDAGADLTVRPTDSWENVRRGFPEGWAPDFITLNLAYGFVPPFLWNAPLPRVGVATDWNLLWHYYRGRLSRCDLVLTDVPGSETMAREGIAARAANLCGCDRMFTSNGEAPEAGLRDIDVLFVGNLNPAVQRERTPWLTRLARLGRRYRVQIRTGLFGEPYRRLLNRARIVFQFSARGKAGRRSFEAANAGALIFQEEGNRELSAFFRDRQECVSYRPDDLEELIDYYLEHEPERLALAEAARERARSCRFEDLWQGEVEEIEKDWPRLRDQAGRPDLTDVWHDLCARSWQALACGRFDDIRLISDIEKFLKAAPDPAPASNLLGCILWRQGRGKTPLPFPAKPPPISFIGPVAARPMFALAGLNLAETLEAAGRRAEAVGVARQTLEAVHRAPELDPASREGMPLCLPFDALHVEWERAAWAAAGRPGAEAWAKRDLILWKLHGLLAAWTGELPHFYEAALRRPDLPASRAALGQALARSDRKREASEHLGRALADNPLDREAARALFQTLGAANDSEGRARLCEDRRLMARAAAQVVPAEPWYIEPRPQGNELASLIVLCYGPMERTQPCLESLLRHSRSPYELILVACGSGDGVQNYLEEFRRRPGPARVELIRNESAPGFAKGCNQGLVAREGVIWRYSTTARC